MAAAAAAASKSSRGCNPWLDLPPELLGLVLLRLPSHADRVRLRAVCRPWRANARLQPLPAPLPWIALPDGDFLSLPDGVVRRLPVPDYDDVVSQRLSAGSELFLVSRRDDTCCLMNPWSSSTASSATTPLPEQYFCSPTPNFFPPPLLVKVVASDHLVAALTEDGHVAVSTRRQLPPQEPASSCSSAGAGAAKWVPLGGSAAIDIALFKEKLYVLTMEQDQEELHVLEDLGTTDDDDEQQTTTIKFVQCIPRIAVDHDDDDDNPYSTDEYYTRKYRYLVPSGDRLLLVKRTLNVPLGLPFNHKHEVVNRTRSFSVLEAAGLDGGGGGGHGRWSKVDTLMGHALFVSNGCCKSLPPVAAAAGQCGGGALVVGAREDSIYYINEEIRRSSYRNWRYPGFRKWRITTAYQDPILDSGVYTMRDRTLTPLPLEAAGSSGYDGPWCPTWIFPAE